MSKHSNPGALPAMLVLGVLIGASLAMASPSRPAAVLSTDSPLTVADEAAGSPRAAKPHACAQSIAALAHRDHGVTQAIAGVLAKCKENPQAPALVNALLHQPGNESGGGDPSGTDAAAGGGGRGGTASADSGGTGGTGGTDGSGSGGTGGSGSTTSGGTGGGGGSGSGSTGTDGSGSTTGGDKDNNGKAKGQFDGKGNNG
jgi:hypothetical protein